jgi:hypothetical protein
MGIDREELKQVIKRNSGAFCHYYQPKKVTHIVAVEMHAFSAKQRRISQNKTIIIVIKPEWLLECDRQQKISFQALPIELSHLNREISFN